MALLKKNDIITIEISAISSDGFGIGKVDGFCVFVPMTDIGEIVETLIIKVTKSFAVGKLLNITSPSDYRCESDCDVYSKCGGCCFRHISYARELELKRQFVENNIKKIGKLDLNVCDIIPSVNEYSYRNKAQYPVRRNALGDIEIGFFASHSHRVIDSNDCHLQPKIFSEIINVLKDFFTQINYSVYDEQSGVGILRHIFLRLAEKTNEIMVCFVINEDKLKNKDEIVSLLTENFNQIKSISVNVNKRRDNVIMGNDVYSIYGNGYITDVLCDVRFRISPLSFYQVNRSTAEVLYKKAMELADLNKDDILLDLYCGIGTIGLSMAKSVKKLYGVEIVPQAVEDAKENAKLNGIENAEFFCADAKEMAIRFAKEGLSPSVIIVDPPRKGCDKSVIESIRDMSPKRVIMISCDSATMARDCKVFEEFGYKVKNVTPVDMFPRTRHCETVVLLSRKKVNDRINFDINIEALPDRVSKTATYAEIKAYVLEHYGLKVSSLYIAQIKEKHGIKERENYNIGEGKSKELICPPEKEEAITNALKHFNMI